MHSEIDHLGDVAAAGAGSKVSQEFLGQRVSSMANFGFKPGTCKAEPCTRVFVLDCATSGRSRPRPIGRGWTTCACVYFFLAAALPSTKVTFSTTRYSVILPFSTTTF